MSVTRVATLLGGIVFAMVSTVALAQNRTFSFAYDQPKSSGYGAGAEMFDKKLKELSKGTLSINQYPGAQLGTSPGVVPGRRWLATPGGIRPPSLFFSEAIASATASIDRCRMACWTRPGLTYGTGSGDDRRRVGGVADLRLRRVRRWRASITYITSHSPG